MKIAELFEADTIFKRGGGSRGTRINAILVPCMSGP